MSLNKKKILWITIPLLIWTFAIYFAWFESEGEKEVVSYAQSIRSFLPYQLLNNGLGLKCIEIKYCAQEGKGDIYDVNYFPFEFFEAVHSDVIYNGHQLIPTLLKFKVDVSGVFIINESNQYNFNKMVYLSFRDTIVSNTIEVGLSIDTLKIQLFNRVNYLGSILQCYRIYNYWNEGTNLLIYINHFQLFGVANECVTSDKESVIISHCGFIPDYFDHTYYYGMGLNCSTY